MGHYPSVIGETSNCAVLSCGVLLSKVKQICPQIFHLQLIFLQFHFWKKKKFYLFLFQMAEGGELDVEFGGDMFRNLSDIEK